MVTCPAAGEKACGGGMLTPWGNCPDGGGGCWRCCWCWGMGPGWGGSWDCTPWDSEGMGPGAALNCGCPLNICKEHQMATSVDQSAVSLCIDPSQTTCVVMVTGEGLLSGYTPNAVVELLPHRHRIASKLLWLHRNVTGGHFSNQYESGQSQTPY